MITVLFLVAWLGLAFAGVSSFMDDKPYRALYLILLAIVAFLAFFVSLLEGGAA